MEHLIRKHAAEAGVEIGLKEGTTWLGVRPPGARVMEQGWKLHVSSRTGALAETAEAIVPALLAEGCAFKMAGSTDALARLNDGTTTPSSIGKAFTVYPDQDRVRAVGLMLAHLLRGRAAPRVLSDRRVAAGAPVYYRYGPIDKPWGADAQGKLVMTLTGPDGEEFPALATLRYRQPAWAVDPFTGEPGARDWERSPNHSTRLGDHYEVDAGIVHAGRGDVMRAVDVRDGSRVIVKQSRALVDEGEDGVDTRLRVRNERRVLAVLEGVDGVAGYVDHFRAGTDEFLVTRDVGRSNLADDVMENGRYAAAAAPEAVPGRTLEQLARQLATVILAVHERGVLIRDLNPRNVVVAPDGSAKLIDLGLAGHNGLYLPGGTSGYSSARQFRHQEATTGDDLLALGTTLCYAWSALPAVVLSRDVDEPRRIALRMIRARCGEAPGGVLGLICDLLSMDDDRVRERGAAHGRRALLRRPAHPHRAPGLPAGDRRADRRDRREPAGRPDEPDPQSPDRGAAHRTGRRGRLCLPRRRRYRPGTAGTPGHPGRVRSGRRPGAVQPARRRRGPAGTGTVDRTYRTRRLPAHRGTAPGARGRVAGGHRGETLRGGDRQRGLETRILRPDQRRLRHRARTPAPARPRRDARSTWTPPVCAPSTSWPTPCPTRIRIPARSARRHRGGRTLAARGHGLAGTVDALAVIGTHLADDTILVGADERARELSGGPTGSPRSPSGPRPHLWPRPGARAWPGSSSAC